jgi:uncharacterized protein involved in exopolysaccharide biosynthesis
MNDVVDNIKKWRTRILIFVLACTAIAAIIVFLQPKEYLSVATAVPASSYSNDKSSIFNENIQQLYSSLGEADDLDRVLGTAALDTVYIVVASQLDLASHYKIDKGPDGLYRAASRLKKHVKVSKSEYGELKVKAWDKDKDVAARMANAVMEKLNTMHQDLNSLSNTFSLKSLEEGRKKLAASTDSAGASPGRTALGEYDKLITQYQLLVDTKPPALIITETAKPAMFAAKPRRKLVIAGSFVLSLVFSLLAVSLVSNSKQQDA